MVTNLFIHSLLINIFIKITFSLKKSDRMDNQNMVSLECDFTFSFFYSVFMLSVFFLCIIKYPKIWFKIEQKAFDLLKQNTQLVFFVTILKSGTSHFGTHYQNPSLSSHFQNSFKSACCFFMSLSLFARLLFYVQIINLADWSLKDWLFVPQSTFQIAFV